MRKFLILGTLAFSILSPTLSQADEIYTFVIKKQEEKAKTRWSLQDWLDTRDRMRLMDLWLALHTSTPYEFFIDGEYRLPDKSIAGSPDSWQLRGGAYASIAGLEFEHGFAQRAETLGLLSLRVFGFHVQGTNITLQGGLRTSPDPVTSRNGVLGAKLTLYLTQFLGIEGSFRHLFSPTSSDPGATPVSNRYTGTGFIDFKYLRVYAEYFAASDSLDPSGVGAGFRFFF